MQGEIHKLIKEDSLNFYDELKEKYTDCDGCGILINKLMEVEGKQCQIIPGDYIEGIGHQLALTPIDELPKLKTTFDEVLSFKEKSIKKNFEEVNKLARHDTKDFITKMKETELSLIKNLTDRRERLRL